LPGVGGLVMRTPDKTGSFLWLRSHRNALAGHWFHARKQVRQLWRVNVLGHPPLPENTPLPRRAVCAGGRRPVCGRARSVALSADEPGQPDFGNADWRQHAFVRVARVRSVLALIRGGCLSCVGLQSGVTRQPRKPLIRRSLLQFGLATSVM
jgi:hypothetical protein